MELKGKIIAFLGDSITEGHGVKDCENNRYDNRLKKDCGLKAVFNYGIGGTRIAHQFVPSERVVYDLNFCGRAYTIDRSADIIVVFGGTNDYGHGDAPIGSIGDRTPATYCGGVWFLMNLLKTEFSGKTVVFMTPAHRVGDEMAADYHTKIADAMPLAFYCDVIKETAKQFDIPVIDMFEALGIDPNKQEDLERFAEDGLHFNDEGHGYIANALRRFLEAL